MQLSISQVILLKQHINFLLLEGNRHVTPKWDHFFRPLYYIYFNQNGSLIVKIFVRLSFMVNVSILSPTIIIDINIAAIAVRITIRIFL